MWLTKKILVACDFADPSREAGDVALEIAESFRVPLVLLHVFQIPTAIYTGSAPMPIVDYTELVEKSARSALRDEAARLQGNHVEVVPLFKIGVAWEEIIGTARRLEVGLIVMGTHGRRCLSRVFMGSVAEKVVRLSPVPVLTIHGSDVKKATKRSGDGQMTQPVPNVAAGSYSTVGRYEPSPQTPAR
jgi:nucleotide-binding universal stress UspA family protein